MFGLLLLVDRARSDRVCGGTPEVDAAPPARHRQCISQTDAPEGLHLPTSQKGEILLPQRVLALLDTDTHYCVFIDLHKFLRFTQVHKHWSRNCIFTTSAHNRDILFISIPQSQAQKFWEN